MYDYPIGDRSVRERFLAIERLDSWKSEVDTDTIPFTDHYYGLNGLRFLITIDAATKTQDEQIE